MALGSSVYIDPTSGQQVALQGGNNLILSTPEAGGCPPNCPDPNYLPGVSDTSLLDKFKAVFTSPTDSGTIIGGAGHDAVLNSAASQDVPQGPDTRKLTDYTATGATPQQAQSSPGVFRLLWNSITGSGPGLFSCRSDSIICAGTGQGANDWKDNGGTGGSGSTPNTNWVGTIQSTLILVVVGLIAVIIIIRKVAP